MAVLGLMKITTNVCCVVVLGNTTQMPAVLPIAALCHQMLASGILAFELYVTIVIFN